MDFNRTIKLTKRIRNDMVAGVVNAWLKEHPRPRMDRIPTSQQLKAMDDWRVGQKRIGDEVGAVLETFTSVNQLSELWPEVIAFVPMRVIDPSKYATLPKAA